MKWLLDTNVICEPGKRRPHPKVVHWLDSLPEQDCALSVITLGEIEKGIHALPPGPQRQSRANALATRATVCRAHPAGRRPRRGQVGRIDGRSRTQRRPLPAVDNLLAATAAGSRSDPRHA